MGCTSLLLAIPCCLALWLLPRKKDYFHNQVAALKMWLAETVSPRFDTYCDRVIERLKSTGYADLSPLLEPAGSNDRLLWKMSNGVRGLWDRAKDAGWRLLLVQVCWANGTISDQDARYVWFLIIGQLWFTLLALPAAGFSYFISGYPRAAAKQSLSFYFRMIWRVNTLCDTPDASDSMLRLYNFL